MSQIYPDPCDTTIRTVLSASCRGKDLRLVAQWDRHIELLKIADAMDAISSAAKNLSVTFFEIEIRAKVVHFRRLCHLGRMSFSMTTAIRSFSSARLQRQAGILKLLSFERSDERGFGSFGATEIWLKNWELKITRNFPGKLKK